MEQSELDEVKEMMVAAIAGVLHVLKSDEIEEVRKTANAMTLKSVEEFKAEGYSADQAIRMTEVSKVNLGGSK